MGIGQIFLVFLVLSSLALWFLPGAIAMRRGMEYATACFLLTIFFGWTGIGWIACMIWAVTGETERAAKRRRYYEELEDEERIDRLERHHRERLAQRPTRREPTF
jgi:hypothetical protein